MKQVEIKEPLKSRAALAGARPDAATHNAGSCFPGDARAIIYRPGRSAMMSGTASSDVWKLRFERCSPPYIEPLMGWTAGDDTLSQVELSFPTLKAAIRYAKQQGLSYSVCGVARPRYTSKKQGRMDVTARAKLAQQRLEWIERTLGPDWRKLGQVAERDPALLFDRPQDLIDALFLTAKEKRELLHRWAFDSYLLADAYPACGGAVDARLNEVAHALQELEMQDNPPHRKAAMAQA